MPYNLAPATSDEPTVFGACRPGHRNAPPGEAVTDWLSFVEWGVDRICCLLDGHLDRYGDLLGTYRERFGAERVLYAPVSDFDPVDAETFCRSVLSFLRAAVETLCAVDCD